MSAQETALLAYRLILQSEPGQPAKYYADGIVIEFGVSLSQAYRLVQLCRKVMGEEYPGDARIGQGWRDGLRGALRRNPWPGRNKQISQERSNG